MEYVGRGVGIGRRANSSLAGVAGSSGLARGGSGFGLRVPLSCAVAVPVASEVIAKTVMRARPMAASCGASIMMAISPSPTIGSPTVWPNQRRPNQINLPRFAGERVSVPRSQNHEIGALERDALQKVGHLATSERGSKAVGGARGIGIAVRSAGAEGDVVDAERGDAGSRFARSSQEHVEHGGIALGVAVVGGGKDRMGGFHQQERAGVDEGQHESAW